MNIEIGRCDPSAENYWRARCIAAQCHEHCIHDTRKRLLKELNVDYLSDETVACLKKAVDAAAGRGNFWVVGRIYVVLSNHYFSTGDTAASLRYANMAVQMGKHADDVSKAAFKEHRQVILAAAKEAGERLPPSHDCYGRPLVDAQGLVDL